MKRIVAIDIIKTIALFFVITVHFFLNNHFYQARLWNSWNFLELCIRNLTYCCVPLFLLITGYLESKKEISYTKLIRPLLSYLFISIIVILVSIIYFGQTASFISVLSSLFFFEAIPYAWYLVMYIGLVLFMPFLNRCFHSLNQKEKRRLLYILILLTAIPSFFKTFFIEFVSPATPTTYWSFLYPVTYYLIGAYFREKSLCITKTHSFLLIVILLLSISGYYWIQCVGRAFNEFIFQGYQNLPFMLLSILLFHFFFSIFQSFPKENWLLVKTASMSLDIYLFSYLFDQLFYTKWITKATLHSETWKYLWIIPCVFICSWIAAFLKNILFSNIEKWIKKEKAIPLQNN